MIYKKFKDLSLSALGLGTMRLPCINGDDSRIDEESAARMVSYAMDQGINYYDTAWGYHNGNSETVMGRILKSYPRDSFYLASKFPGYDLSNMTKVEEIFEKQLEKCQVDYFDFYLFHNVWEMNIDAYLDDEKYGVFSYLMKQKENGRIPPSWIFRSWKSGCDQAFPGSLRRSHGILPASDQLSGLGFPKRQRKS